MPRIKGASKEYHVGGKYALGARKLFWSSRKSKSVREKYKDIRLGHEKKLGELQQQHGSPEAVSTVYHTLKGVSFARKKNRFDGVVDVLKKGKKFEKLKKVEREEHIKTMESLVSRLESVEGNSAPGRIRDELVDPLKNYLEKVKDIHSGGKQQLDKKFVDELLKKSKEHTKSIKETNENMSDLAVKIAACKSIEYFANDIPYYKANLEEYRSEARNASHTYGEYYDLFQKKNKSAKERQKLAQKEAQLEGIKETLDKENHFVSSLSEPVAGKVYKKVTVCFDDLSKQEQKEIKRYIADSNLAVAGSAILGTGMVVAGPVGALAAAGAITTGNLGTEISRHLSDIHAAERVISSIPQEAGQRPILEGDALPLDPNASPRPATEFDPSGPIQPRELPAGAMASHSFWYSTKVGAAYAIMQSLNLRKKANERIGRFKEKAIENPNSVLDLRVERKAGEVGKAGLSKNEAREISIKPTAKLLKAILENSDARLAFSKHGITIISDKGAMVQTS